MVAAALVGLCMPAPALAVLEITYSPDIVATLGGQVIFDEQPADDNLAGTVTAVGVGTIPASADLVAYHREPDGDQHLCFDTTVELGAGPLTVRPGDVVRFDGATYSLEFDASANGVPRGVSVDALAVVAGDLVLSFDVTVALSGETFHDEDLALFAGAAF